MKLYYGCKETISGKYRCIVSVRLGEELVHACISGIASDYKFFSVDSRTPH